MSPLGSTHQCCALVKHAFYMGPCLHAWCWTILISGSNSQANVQLVMQTLMFQFLLYYLLITCCFVGITFCFRRGSRRAHKTNSLWCYISSWCGNETSAVNDVHSCGQIVFLITRRVLSSAWRWQGSLVWFSPVGEAKSVENDVKYWWYVTLKQIQ